MSAVLHAATLPTMTDCGLDETLVWFQIAQIASVYGLDIRFLGSMA